MFSLKLLLFCFAISGNAFGARILGIFHIPSRSHHILGSRLLKSLAEKGHDVTMVSPYPFKEKIENYRDIPVKEMLEFKEDNMQSLMKPSNLSAYEMLLSSVNMFYNANDLLLSLPQVQQLKSEHFDLVISLGIIQDSLLAFSHHFKAPAILFSTIGSTPSINDILGNPAPPAYISGLGLEGTNRNPFVQRLINTVSAISNKIIFGLVFTRGQEKLIAKYFPGAPGFEKLTDNVALAFVNSHYSFESPRPYVPNVIQVGGLHVEEPKELPKDLKEYLDSAKDGAIFFSLGSNVRISDLPENTLSAMIKGLEKTNMKVLFKSEMEIPNLPKNIKTGKWLPQNDILAHPNVRLFISHGGLLSTIEAIYHAVPIVGMPIFGDQHMNMANAVAKGYALRVDIKNIEEDSFYESIKEALNNPSYKENVQLRSKILHEQPLKPLELAIFWVEHVLKFGGADHLKNEGAKLPLYQYLLLDVFFVMTFVVVIILTVIYFSVKLILKIIKSLFRRNKVKTN